MQCHSCGKTGVPLEPCPYWLDVNNADPELERYDCADCAYECAMDI